MGAYARVNLDLFSSPDTPVSRTSELHGMPLRVYEWISTRGAHGGTRWEMAQQLQILDQSLGRVIRDLRNGGHIEATGDTRATGSGRQARIYVAVK